MGAVRARVFAELRRRALSLVLFSLVVGIAAGCVMSLAAGARRTESAYDRFLDRSAPSDVWIQSNDSFVGPGVDLDTIAALPQVERVARGTLLFTGVTTPSGRTLPFGEFTGIASADGQWGTTVDRWSLVEGRRSDPRRPDEILLGFDEAERLDAHVGDTLGLVFPTTDRFTAAYVSSLGRLADAAAGRSENIFDVEGAVVGAVRLRAKVVGIVAMPGSVPPFAGSISGAVQLTPAFYDRYADGLANTGFLAVQIRQGASLEAFKTAVEGLDGNALFLTSRPTQTKAVDRSLALQANVLWTIGAVVLFVLLLLLAQALARLTASESTDFPTLRALGMTRRELFLVGLGRACVVAVPVAVLGAVTAMALSVFWPAGLAGTIEPAPGFAVDAAVIVVGAVLAFAVVVLLAAWPAWRVAGGRRGSAVRTSSLARTVGIANPGFSARLGARLTLEPGRAARGVPVRTAIAVGATAIAATALMVGFSSSLTHLRDTPDLYGWTWDAQIGARGLPDLSGPLLAGLETNPAVGAIAVGAITNVTIDGARVDALALDAVRGRIAPRLLEGRAARAVDEIVLGSTTMRDLDVDIGDDVAVGLGDESATVKVVGRGVFPNLGDAAQLGRGAAMSLDALAALDASATRNIVLVRFAPDRAPGVARATLTSALTPYPVLGPERPDDLVSLGNAQGLAVALGVLLAALAAATLGHTLVAAARRRATDLAVLKALGATRRQVGAVIGWQATGLVVVALVIGIPVGVVAARAAWSVLADQLGVPSEPTLNVVALALIVPVFFLLALLAASGPALAAARIQPARALRNQ